MSKTTKRQASEINYKKREHPFCKAMREKREELGISYQTLADRIGTGSRSYLADVEKGKYAVSMEVGLMICQYLDIDIDDCIDFICTVEMDRIRDQIKRAYNEWLDMTPDDVRDRMLSTPNAQFIHANLAERGEEHGTEG